MLNAIGLRSIRLLLLGDHLNVLAIQLMLALIVCRAYQTSGILLCLIVLDYVGKAV